MTRRSRPVLLSALAVTGIYVLLAGAYIVLSSAWAGTLELTVDEHVALETKKGLAFVSATGLILFGVVFVFLRQVHAAEVALIERTHELGKAQQQASVAAVAAMVAHDMKNQLTVSLASYDALKELELEGDLAEARDDLGASLARLREMSLELMQRANDHARPRSTEVDLAVVARSVRRMARHLSPYSDRALDTHVDSGCVVHADPRDLEQAILNLVLNAIEAAEGRGHVLLQGRCLEGDVVLDVIDDGPGIPEDVAPHIFAPYFTTKSSQGTGLGLATVRQVVEQHGGRIEHVPTERGTQFRITLPRAGRAAA